MGFKRFVRKVGKGIKKAAPLALKVAKASTGMGGAMLAVKGLSMAKSMGGKMRRPNPEKIVIPTANLQLKGGMNKNGSQRTMNDILKSPESLVGRGSGKPQEERPVANPKRAAFGKTWEQERALKKLQGLESGRKWGLRVQALEMKTAEKAAQALAKERAKRSKAAAAAAKKAARKRERDLERAEKKTAAAMKKTSASLERQSKAASKHLMRERAKREKGSFVNIAKDAVVEGVVQGARSGLRAATSKRAGKAAASVAKRTTSAVAKSRVAAGVPNRALGMIGALVPTKMGSGDMSTLRKYQGRNP